MVWCVALAYLRTGNLIVAGVGHGLADTTRSILFGVGSGAALVGVLTWTTAIVVPLWMVFLELIAGIGIWMLYREVKRSPEELRGLMRIHREIEEKIKQVIVKRYKSGEWYALVCIDKKSSVIVQGQSMGIKSFLTDSDGRQIENPKFYKPTLERIRIEQRKRSRTKKGSKKWKI